MIPTFAPSQTPPSAGRFFFHAILDDLKRQYFLSGPDGPNGLRLHYEVELERRHGAKWREFDIRADNIAHAVAQIANHLPDYRHLGPWTGSRTGRQP